MSRYGILALSAALTALVLVLAGGVAGYVLRPEPTASAGAADSVPGDVVRAREAEYRRQLEEANARLRTSSGLDGADTSAERLATASRGPEREKRGEHEGRDKHGRHGHHQGHGEDDDG